MSGIAINVDSPDEIFAEREGEARISFSDLEAQGEDGRQVLETIRDYIVTHPKLETRIWRHENGLTGTELVIQWHWRR